MGCGPPGSSVHGILQARILEWVAMPSSGESSDPGIDPLSLTFPALAVEFFFILFYFLPLMPHTNLPGSPFTPSNIYAGQAIDST